VQYVRNRAAYLANGDILYYTDDDMIADPALLRHLIRVFGDTHVGAATGKVLSRWGRAASRLGAEAYAKRFAQPSRCRG
jgi:cellulose synthase/poly-beta-1,6-N-acetylglucosamine synthase-like glycosyltransferase